MFTPQNSTKMLKYIFHFEQNLQVSSDMTVNKDGKFLKKLWCSIDEGYNKIQLNLYLTVTCREWQGDCLTL